MVENPTHQVGEEKGYFIRIYEARIWGETPSSSLQNL